MNQKRNNMAIRDEKDSDAAAISELTRAAFKNHPYSQHTEQDIIIALRHHGALTLSLVSEPAGKIVGHIAFSPVLVLAQLNLTIGDMAGNVFRMTAAARTAQADGAELVIFSELSLTGYSPGDLLEEADFLARVA
jgi:hypothetical protein